MMKETQVTLFTVLMGLVLSQTTEAPNTLPAGCPVQGDNLQCMLGKSRIELGHVAPTGSVCRDVITDLHVHCAEDGTWKLGNRNLLNVWRHSRQRRGAAAAAGVASAVIAGLTLVVDLIFKIVEVVNQDAPPTIRCPSSLRVFAPPLQTHVYQEWKTPDAQDDKGIEKGPVCDPESESKFPEGESQVQCWAMDGKGQMAVCSFAVVVTVRRCPTLTWPEDGSVSCPQGTLEGSVCTLTCDEGYRPRGASTSTCTGIDWTVPVFRCKPIGCSQVPDVENGIIACPAAPVFQTVCQLSCDQGFRLRGTPTVLCQGEEGFTPPGRCEDDEDPAFPNGCPDNIEEFAAPLGSLTVVSWTAPRVKDNSGSYNLTCSHDSSRGFPPGRHTVLYTASDAANNMASCSFQISIKTISCLAPSFDTSDKNLMLYTCPQGRVVGAQCTVSCRSGYPLAGPRTLYCDRDDSVYPPTGYWSTHDTTNPECRVTPCPGLKPPQNGALSCDQWGYGQICSLMCNEKYDIPLQALRIGDFVCGTSTGTWRPTDVVPGCTEKRQPESMRLPSKLYYYAGNCPDNATQEQIKINFIEILKSSKYVEKCTDVPECRVENVLVKCGPISPSRRRRHVFKRSTRMEIEIDFSIAATLPSGQSGTQAASILESVLSDVASVLTQEAAMGAFNLTVDGEVLEGENITTGTPRFVCEEGTLISPRNTCAGCASGSYFNSSVKDCQNCPVGHYEDVGLSTSCKPCPTYTSTNGTGKASVNDCVAQCRPGWVSDTGLEPCQQCQVGSYQTGWGQTLCSQCPSNSSTPTPGASSPDQCLEVSGCDASPCGNHSCVAIPGRWLCQCHGGWTGADCSTPPDLCLQHQCQNGATCVNGLHNYSCVCERGFKGQLCSVAIRNGGWSVWSNWTECSVTCGGGSRSRRRDCDSPSPDPDGLTCAGPSLDSQSCASQDCPSCPPLPEPTGVVWNCTKEEEMTSCTMDCREGLVLAKRPLPLYQCGRATNYSWPFVETAEGFMPECTEPLVPTETRVRVTAEVRLDCQEASIHGSQGLQGLRAASLALDCVRNQLCRAVLALSPCDPGDGDVTSVNITLDLLATSSPGRVNLTADVINSTDPSLDPTRHYLELLTSLSRTLTQLLRNPVVFLTVQVGDQQYPPSTPSPSGSVTCPPGTVPAQVACGKCPRGTYQSGVQCVLCGQGSYADSTGSMSCSPCPPGFSTPGLGSTSRSQCRPGTSSGATESDRDNQRREILQESTINTLVVAVSVTVALVVSLAVIGVIIVVIRYKLRQKGTVGCFDTPVDPERARKSKYVADPPLPSYDEATRGDLTVKMDAKEEQDLKDDQTERWSTVSEDRESVNDFNKMAHASNPIYMYMNVAENDAPPPTKSRCNK